MDLLNSGVRGSDDDDKIFTAWFDWVAKIM